jgi:HPt (histidine-containing phosphotransfer) domain-containing protein
MRKPLLDASQLYSEFGDDPDLGQIVELFVGEMPQRLTALNRCLLQRDWDELGRLAHQLKGACGSYGFHQLTPFAARLEGACRSEDQAKVEIHEAAATLIGLSKRCRAGASQ